jgi:hypothetical protein
VNALRALRAGIGACLGVLAIAAHAEFDQQHAQWDALLKRDVVVAASRVASTVRYADLKQQRGALHAYLVSLSGVTQHEYDGWSRAQQLAFLINAYNAFTVDLILSRYPDLKSIKDLGNVFQSPWKRTFFQLLGEGRSLDDVEHGLIRAPGTFDDPRVHFALVCASIGCPMLRNEAYVGERLDEQLDDAMQRFLSDHARNRFEAATGTLDVSKIFDWYSRDFTQGHHGFDSLQTLFSRNADALAPGSTQAQADLRSGRFKLEFLEYDWRLNDAR